MSSPPVVLSIAGSDCSAGAGIQADLKSFHTLDTYGLTVVSGVVAETPNKVVSWEAMPAKLVREQLECLLESYPVAAIKTGLLFSPEIVQCVAQTLKGKEIPLIIDPVGSASAGASFGGETFLTSLSEQLFPLAALITPNLREAQALAGLDSDDQAELGSQLAHQFGVNVLVKGGHHDDPTRSIDLLTDPNGRSHEFCLPRLTGPDYHGTGCTLSASIAAYIARGTPLKDAIMQAKSFLHQAISAGHHWESGPTGEHLDALNLFNRNS